jgi:hypothetical protein
MARCNDVVDPDGFVDWYSTTNAVEDRASVLEYMMAKYARGGDLMYGTAPCVHGVAGR